MTRARWLGQGLLIWQRAHTSLWFVPTVLVIAAVALSTILLRTDAALGTSYSESWWLFGGSADGARTVLSVIAGSLITVIAVAFSVTMIAIQQASTQYTPRVLQNFTRDRGNQVVLGTYIATFTYALLVLRRVRESGDDGAQFVPSIAISTGMLLALVSLGMLVYFIHHVSEALQVTSLMSSVRRELDREIEHMFPTQLGESAAEPASFEEILADSEDRCVGQEITVTCDHEGYLRRIDQDELQSAAGSRIRMLRVEVQIGDYLRRGDLLLRAWCSEPPGDSIEDRLIGAFQLDRDRSLHQDPLFGVRQLVDIGVKALSPGVNDPTTAEQALDQLGGALRMLLDRSFPSPLRELETGALLLLKTPTFAEYVDAAFAQMRRAARTDLHVSLYLVDILRKLADQADAGRAVVLRRHMDDVVAGFDREPLTDGERAMLDRQSHPGVSNDEHGASLPH